MSKTDNGTELPISRKKRVQRLKKIIMLVLVIALLVPNVTCLVLSIRMVKLQTQMDRLETLVQEMSGTQSDNMTEVSSVSGTETSIQTGSEKLEERAAEPEESEAARIEKDGLKKVYLTFDDGPSGNTEKILDILKQYGVKATFFVIGREQTSYQPIYRRIVEEGHTLGMHSHSHEYQNLYASLDSFAEDFTKEQSFLYQTTGIWPKFYRFPGGSSNTVSKVDMRELTGFLEEQDVTFFDWNVTSGDGGSYRLSAETIVHNVTNLSEGDRSVVLMHDSMDKPTTVEALPEIIETLQAMENVEIVPITEFTEPVQHILND
ncbi:MAG: polysaccharide deacetylase [Lachnospiraceae bacterium]|nr:polysaccharide deacetylase [Lachnospiraceae bacterium]